MIIDVFFATLCAVAFSIFFNIRGVNLLLAAIGGGICYAFFLLIYPYSSLSAFFISSVSLAAYSEITARIRKTPAATFLVAGLIPTVPGKGMFDCMLRLLEGKTTEALFLAVTTLLEAGAIAVGIIVVTSLVKLFPSGGIKRPHSAENPAP